MQMPAELLRALALALALRLLVLTGACKDVRMANEVLAVNQPFAFNCTHPPLTFGDVNVTWYKAPRNISLSRNITWRIHQEHTWILILPLSLEDSGMYQCVIKNTKSCYRVHVNLTVVKNYSCVSSGSSLPSLSNEYSQILYTGNSGSLRCHLYFPDSCLLDSIKWYKDCKEITREQQKFVSSDMKLFVYNVSAEDGGNYTCTAILKHQAHPRIQYMVLNSITVSITERGRPGGRIPKIIYPQNNSIEVRLDTKENTNLRCWKVNNTMVDDYYSDSKRIQEGIENNVSFPEHIFYTVNITFLEVKMEDYGLPFTCHAGVSAAYIMLRFPAPDFRAYLIGGFVALAVVVTSVLGVYRIFKVDIVLWYRSTFHSAETREDGKLYDAYVLYPKPKRDNQCHKVDTLVLKLLPEVLERQCGYKLFIFGRDDFPGQAVANVIDENIKLCRRLIVILTRQSSSCGLLKNLSEEQIAVYSALIQDGMKVILIELERIEDYSTMPESIQYIRQKHGAVRWRGDSTEQSQCSKTKFWKKVRYHMPPRRYPPFPLAQLQRHTPYIYTAGKWEPNVGPVTH
ncbi:interleukin-1 receptor-like 2 isoform X2 [Heterocephalus glaber]|uniref:Interleukin-1 receptor-like 2 isoform X2 n=1 Tax=Heterocephalus glaber TaxID=10181 RepID=A0AAX6SX10_HETGA|nr:interleukin-1 receptor-like 2 isoform X2 [Heterocephalus glaber]